MPLFLSPELEHLGNGSSLPVLEGDSLRLVCDTDSNPPASLSWSRGSRTLSPSHPLSPGVLYLRRVESGHDGELTCRAQHPRGSLWVSLHLSVQSELGVRRGEEDTRERTRGRREGTDTTDSPPSPQPARSCWAPPAPRRTGVCAAAAPPEPCRPPPCAGGSGRGCWRGSSATPPSRSAPAPPGPGPTVP